MKEAAKTASDIAPAINPVRMFLSARRRSIGGSL